MTRLPPGHVFLGAALALFLAACSGDSPTVSSNTPEPDPVVHREWAFLLYDDADFQNAYNPLADFTDHFRGGDEVHVLVLNDPATSGASILRIDETGVTARVRELGEVNMGSARTLGDFLTFAQEFYPANRYIVAFYDHGGAWLGSCWDGTSGNDNLTMEEMREGLALGGGVDLILFTAPCNMGSLEAAYEVREETEIYIGSEDSSGYIWWHDPLGDISAALHANPQISNHELAQLIIDALGSRSGQWQGESWGGKLTMSAVRTDKLEVVKDRVDALSEAYLAQGDHLIEMVEAVRPRLTSFGPFLVDVHSLAHELYEEDADDEIRGALLGLLEAMDEAMLAEYSGPAWPGAEGLTIFLPDQSSANRLSQYTGDSYGLDFPSDTSWDELMAVYLAQWGSAPEGVASSAPSTSSGLYPSSCLSGH